ncbi:hypothetical protein [Roseimicrobium sp. ORNL1]|uniref:hypothetical protein n=1 Tax=Roseimicrobium sp. ORNL1 TaxID=2711231 RepID=UPI0013E1E916|nr:hypothetical protein [Roseimicrobium sp. ORNL1]QIE99976.1 hypothetical protein G5S37_00030 [Roseimicrobium sp. ORNL1]
MTRRQLHHAISIGITVPALVLMGYCVLVQRQAVPFLITCGGYVVALLLAMLLLRANVPPHKRQRPDAPPELARLKLGLQGERLAEVLAEMNLDEQRTMRRGLLLRPRQYELYKASRTFANGTWTWWVETSGGEIVACAASYQSDESPVLDTGWTKATGSSVILHGSSG